MNNQQSLSFFKTLAVTAKNPDKAIKLGSGDLTEYDTIFIMRYLDKETDWLDIGTGSGLIVNKIYDKCASVTAIEPLSEYSQYITKAKNINIVSQNILFYSSNKTYDLITCFGVMHYFNELEAKKVYGNLYCILKNTGRIIIKNQFALKEDVTIEHYSKELDKNYFANYRSIKKECQLLANVGFRNFEIIDIYPPKKNRWSNTHFYAITAQKG